MEAKNREWGEVVDFNPGWIQFRRDEADCPRCDGSHPNLLYKRLRQPTKVKIDSGWIYLTHWATCPETGEPIRMLIRRIESVYHISWTTTGTSGSASTAVLDYVA